jgi:hypothetical protein
MNALDQASLNVTPLTDAESIRRSIRRLESQLRKGARSVRKRLGFRGGHGEGLVWWRADLGFWFHIGSPPAAGSRGRATTKRYWCCYGTDNPFETRGTLRILVEVNPPHSGFNRTVAGAFVEGPGRRIFLAHSGKVGGGREGRGKKAFTEFYPGPTWADVRWPDERVTRMILIGELADPHLPHQIATFVHEVDRFNESLRAPAAEGVPKSRPGPTARVGFSPEFEGDRASYRIDREIHSVCDHGVIVRHLRERLKHLDVANDPARDLFVKSADGRVRVLLEVKTDSRTSDLYMGIGQLMINGATQTPSPRRVLVVPNSIADSDMGLVRSTGIDVVRYEWSGDAPAFVGLDAIAELRSPAPK